MRDRQQVISHVGCELARARRRRSRRWSCAVDAVVGEVKKALALDRLLHPRWRRCGVIVNVEDDAERERELVSEFTDVVVATTDDLLLVVLCYCVKWRHPTEVVVVGIRDILPRVKVAKEGRCALVFVLVLRSRE